MLEYLYKKCIKNHKQLILFILGLLFFNSVAFGEDIKLSDLPNKRLGLINGAATDKILQKYDPNLKDENFIVFPSFSDALLALKNNKIDVLPCEYMTALLSCNKVDGLKLLSENYAVENFGYFLKKGNPFFASFKEAVNKVEKSGKIDALKNIWSSNDAGRKILPKQDWPATNGTFVFGCSSTAEPSCYVDDSGNITGFDPAVIVEVARELQMHVTFEDIGFAGLIAALNSGKVDVIGTCLTITEERKEAADVVKYTSGYVAFVVKNTENSHYDSISELYGKRIGVTAGSVTDKSLMSYDSNFKHDDFIRIQSLSDGVLAIKSNKLDAMVEDYPACLHAFNNNTGIKIIPLKKLNEDIGFGFAKGSSLTKKFEKAIKELAADGTIKKLEEIWLGSDNSKKILPKQDWSATNGTFRFADTALNEPMCYIDPSSEDNGGIVGFEVAVIYAIAKKLQMHVKVIDVDFSGIIAVIHGHKADVIGSSLTITPERLIQIDMVKFYESCPTFVVRGSLDENNKSFWEDLKGSFHKTFVLENRWKLIVNGLGVTIAISLGAVILGIVLGFIFILIGRLHIRFLTLLIEIFCKVILGIPAVVFLMILYYVVFGKVDINPIYVAIIGFGISYGTAAYGIMKTGIDAVDLGQEEASLALGFTSCQAFFKVILPQAAKHFLPLMKGEFIGMVKMTSIVGYIAGQDLTKATDIIRARTMEAFFPLIVTAVIYFVIANLLTYLLTKIQVAIDPKSRARIVKGVK